MHWKGVKCMLGAGKGVKARAGLAGVAGFLKSGRSSSVHLLGSWECVPKLGP